ncbi:MAG: BREX protein BrxB domain-containing protein [Desulfomonilaceae bacterium]
MENTFNELMQKIRDPEALNPARSDPIFYFAYPPELMLDLKKRLPRWMSRIREAGFEVRRVSLADILWQTVDESHRWETWLELEPEADANQINEAVRDVLRQGNAMIDRLADNIESAPEGTVVLLTEAELLHPYFRTRIIESRLHDKVRTPTVIFYPGRRSGQYGLHFLDFYPVDGNYRSTLLGGL